MIYFFDVDMQLRKVVTSKNLLAGYHEHELNGVIMSEIELDLNYSKDFINEVSMFGYYYKDVFYLHHIQRTLDMHDVDAVNISGRHIFFNDMIFGKLIEDVRPENRTAKAMLEQTIQENTRWNIVTHDETGTLTTNFYWQSPYDVLSWIIENFRLEYEPRILFDGKQINDYQLHIFKKMGSDTGIRIPFGDRVLSLTHDIDYSEVVTKLAVRGKGEETEDGGYGRRITLEDVDVDVDGIKSPIGDYYLENPDISLLYENTRHAELIFEDVEDVETLKIEGVEAYIDMSRPKMNFEADVQNIGDVRMGDSVWVIRHEHDIYYNMRIQMISADLLNDSETHVELGDYWHFKESKSERIERRRRENLENEQQRIDGDVRQIRSDVEQVKIDVSAEIDSSKTDLLKELDDRIEEFGEGIDEWLDFDAIRLRVLDMSGEDAEALFNKLTALDVFVNTIKGIEMEFSEAEIDTIRSKLLEVIVLNAQHIEMDSAFYQKLIGGEGSQIFADFIKTLNLKADNIEGGDIELSRGIRITNNGNVVMEVTSDGRFRFDATAAGVATKQELENIEIGTRNLIPHTDFREYEGQIDQWSPWTSRTEIWHARQVAKYMLFRNADPTQTGSNTIGVVSPTFTKTVNTGREYTIRFLGVGDALNNPFDYCYLMNIDGEERADGVSGNMPVAITKITHNYERRTDNTFANLYELTFVSQWTGRAAFMVSSTINLNSVSNHWISEPMLVEGNKAPKDWTPAPEDLIYDFNTGLGTITDYVNGIRTDVNTFQSLLESKQDIDEYNQKIEEIEEALATEERAMSEISSNVSTLMGRQSAAEWTLGEHSQTVKFVDTYMTEGDEGLFIHTEGGTNGILIDTERISFISSGDDEIFYISGQNLYIKSGIIVNSFQIGTHRQVRLNSNSTITEWVEG